MRFCKKIDEYVFDRIFHIHVKKRLISNKAVKFEGQIFFKHFTRDSVDLMILNMKL